MSRRKTAFQRDLNLDSTMAKLRSEVELYRTRGKTADADFLGSVIEQIEDARRRDHEQLVDLHVAAEESGYSVRQLRRLVGTAIENRNPAGKPMMTLKDLPKKAGGRGSRRAGSSTRCVKVAA